MPNPADAGARYVPRAWSFDDHQPTGGDRLRRAGGRERPAGGRERRRLPRDAVLAAVDRGHPSRPVLVVAGQVAELLGGTVRTVVVEAGAIVPALVDASRGVDVGALVLDASAYRAGFAAALGRPVVVAPPHAQRTGVIRRLLVDPDGITAGAQWLMEAALDAGREVVVVAAGTLTPALALERHADLVVLGWSPWLSPRRAGAVRPFLECPPAPVALLPVPARRWR